MSSETVVPPARTGSLPSLPPTTRVGPYELVSLIGSGGMGTVYRAVHTVSGVPVAVKMGRTVVADDLESIRREIRALSRVRHPGVVRILDEGAVDGLPWFAMELLEGPTLSQHLDAMRAAEPGWPTSRLHEVLTLFARICEPLEYIHDKGIVHGDLKPENVHIRSDGTPVLLDFGLFAHFSGRSGREILQAGGAFGGTDQYLAPEQIWGELVDARADLYALGCMLYEAITGVCPFVGKTAQEVLHRHLTAEPVPPSRCTEGVPAWLDDLVLALLKKSRRDRLGYAAIVSARLREHLTLPSPVAHDASTPYLYRPELVGRSEAVARLAALVDQSIEGRGGVVFVTGDSGIGKTRIAQEAATLAARRGMGVLLGVCGEPGAATERAGTPLRAFRAVFDTLADRCRTGGREETDRLLGPRGSILAAYEPGLALLPGQAEYAPPAPLSPEGTRGRLQRALADTLIELARTTPLLVVLDDLQWADEVSLGVLDELHDPRIATVPLLIVVTCRSEAVVGDVEKVVHKPGGVSIELGRLDPDGIRRVVSDMLAMAAAPAHFVDTMFDHAEGNPFFVSEYLLVAVGEGHVYRDDLGQWRLRARDDTAGIPTLAVPHSLRELVDLRLSALERVSLDMVRVGSVLGRSFDDALLIGASGVDEAAAMAIIQDLTRRRVFNRDAPGVLSFGHGEIRRIAYESIPRATRAELHESAAKALERSVVDPAARLQHCGTLAHHWSSAADVDAPAEATVVNAIDALERAGEQAVRVYANQEIVRLFARAAELYAGHGNFAVHVAPERRARWERHLGEACYRLGRPADARAHLGSSLSLRGERVPASRSALVRTLVREVCRQAVHRALPQRFVGRSDSGRDGTVLEAARAYELLSFLQFLVMERGLSLAANLRAMNLSELARPSPELANCYAMTGLSAGIVGGRRFADVYFRLGLEVANQVGDANSLGRVRMMNGFFLLGQAEWDAAHEALASALATFERIGDIRWRESAMLHLGNLHQFRSRYAESLPLYDEPRRTSAQRGDVQTQAWSMIGRIGTLVRSGKTTEAIAMLDTLDGLLGGDIGRLADRGSEFSTLTQRAMCHVRVGDLHAADEVAGQARAIIGNGPVLIYLALHGHMNLAEVYLSLWERCADGAAASERLARSAKLAVRDLRRAARYFPLGRPAALLWRGLHEWLRGNQEKASVLWSRGAAVARDLGMPHEEAQAYFQIGRHLAAGNSMRREHLDRARRIFAAIGADYELAESDRLLAAG